jgi:hypothetical protein
MGFPHIVRSPAVLGLAQQTRAELVPFGTNNLRGENIRQFHDGEAATRFGFAAYSGVSMSSGGAQNAVKMFADGTTIHRVIHTSNGFGVANSACLVEGYDPQAAQWALLAGQLPECSQRILALSNPGASNTIEDIAYTNGYIAVTWYVTTSTTIRGYAAVLNATTFETVSAPIALGVNTFASPGAIPQLVAVGTSFILVLPDASNAIKARYLDTVNGASIVNGWTVMPDLAADAAGSHLVAVCSLPHATLARAAIVYLNTGGRPTSRLTLKTFNASGALDTLLIDTSSTAPTGADVTGVATDTLWVTWNEATAVKSIGLSPLAITGAPLASTATIITAVSGVSSIGSVPLSTAGQARLFVNSSSPVMQCHMRTLTTQAGAALGVGTQTNVYSAQAAGRPWVVKNECYIPVIVSDTGNVQQQIVVAAWTADLTYLRPVACPSPGLSTLGQVTRRSAVVVGNKAYTPINITRSSVARASALVEMDFANIHCFNANAWGNSAYVTGGVVSCSDGVRVAEVGYLARPPKPATSLTGTGISATVGWRYVTVYEQVDADGNWHQSGISDPSDSTGVVTNKTVNVTSMPLTVSGRVDATGGTGVRVVIYRTADGGVAPYYRLDMVPNDTTAGAISYADGISDAVLITGAKLYEQPGVLGTAQDRRPPPGFSCLVSYSGMLVGSTGSDVWYSGQNVVGEGAWFSPVFQTPIPGDGDITALAVMDGTLFVFKRSEIYAVVGETPSDSGSQGGLGTPRRLAVDVGALGPVVCTASIGIFFQSERGIEVLTRAQTAVWVGQPVQDTLATYPVVTSMTVDPSNSGTVLIELAASQASGLVAGTGRTLVYDLSSSAWISTDRRTSSTGAVDVPSQSACIVSTSAGYRYAWMTSGGIVHYEDRTSYKDANGSFVTTILETGWFNGYQNEQRVYRASFLFQQYTAAGLLVETAYNYGAYSALDNAVWSETETLGQRQLEVALSPRGETVKFRISTTAGVVLGTGQGISVFAIALDLAAKQGPTKGTVRLDPGLRR